MVPKIAIWLVFLIAHGRFVQLFGRESMFRRDETSKKTHRYPAASLFEPQISEKGVSLDTGGVAVYRWSRASRAC